MFYIYVKNRILFVLIFSMAMLLVLEATMYFVFDEKPHIVSILIEIPFFVFGAWLYHYKRTKQLEKANGIKIK